MNYRVILLNLFHTYTITMPYKQFHLARMVNKMDTGHQSSVLAELVPQHDCSTESGAALKKCLLQFNVVQNVPVVLLFIFHLHTCCSEEYILQ